MGRIPKVPPELTAILRRVEGLAVTGADVGLVQELAGRGILAPETGVFIDPGWVGRVVEAGGAQRFTEALTAVEEGRRSFSGPDFTTVTRPWFLAQGGSNQHLPLRRFAGVEAPAEMTVVHGGEVPFTPPPSITLGTGVQLEILQLLEYAGAVYSSPTSPAAELGARAFAVGRRFAQKTRFQQIAFDWDHVVDNYRIFEQLLGAVWTRMHTEYPLQGDGRLTSLETARPFMHELIFGMAAGFALRQGLNNFQDWESYRPQVGLATLTWPDRLGVLSRYIPLISLMDARFPGRPDVYEKTVASAIIVHQDDFLRYAQALLTRARSQGTRSLTTREQREVAVYFEQGKGHYAKPLGAIAAKWGDLTADGGLMLFDDSFAVTRETQHWTVRDAVLGVYLPNPYRPHSKDVREGDKISFGLTREARVRRAAQAITDSESRTVAPALLRYLERLIGAGGGNPQSAPFKWTDRDLTPVPDGTIVRLSTAGTTLREFHANYVAPTRAAKQRIRATRISL